MAQQMTFPQLVEGNGHAILFFRDPNDYPYLREVTPMLAFKHGLPNVNMWEKYGDDLVGIECPTHADEDGIPCPRAWCYTTVDKNPTRDWIPTDALLVRSDSIVPGLPSRPYMKTAAGCG